MSHLEEAILRRFEGSTIVLFGLTVAVAGLLPLLLYVAFGPEDGNPVRLGLLAIAAVPTGGIIALAGIIKLLVRHFQRDG